MIGEFGPMFSSVIAWTEKLSVNERALVLAMCWVESKFDQFAVRTEKDYQWVWRVPEYAKKMRISIDTEQALQSMSFGVMQVMGATARWQGFDQSILLLAADPELGFHYGLKYIRHQMGRYRNNEEKAIAAYNAGHADYKDGKLKNQDYVNEVLQKKAEFLEWLQKPLA